MYAKMAVLLVIVAVTIRAGLDPSRVRMAETIGQTQPLAKADSPGWFVKYLQPAHPQPRSPSGQLFYVAPTRDKCLPSHMKLERVSSEASGRDGELFTLTDGQGDEARYIVYWRSAAGVSNNYPPPCDYNIEALR